MIVNLYSPEGKNLVSVDQGTLWCSNVDIENSSSRSYTKKLTFEAKVNGDYTMEATVLTDHVEKVYVKLVK